MAIVHLGIGSNIGDRKANCERALELLGGRGIKIKKVSSMYETKPWGLKEQPDFINMAAEAETDLSPEKLLDTLKRIEKEMGREETVKWGPRVIDLDILFYNDAIVDTQRLRIPHPFFRERDFVVTPLAEIAPDKVHPVLKKSVRQLREELKDV
ncbi:MAG TPA: 2-amino-4-hydroxy-6-hydroxymethyldihydropteridine diphosphokinase [Dissulfurispiraceae bacterium]